jgi:hypothetical protein
MVSATVPLIAAKNGHIAALQKHGFPIGRQLNRPAFATEVLVGAARMRKKDLVRTGGKLHPFDAQPPNRFGKNLTNGHSPPLALAKFSCTEMTNHAPWRGHQLFNQHLESAR